MKADILSIEGKKTGTIDLPSQFNEEIRHDLIQRSVLALQSKKRQSYGSFKEAGKRASAKLSRRRHDYKGAYGRGMSRVPRKTLVRRGTQFIWVGAVAPGTVGGRRAHPPKPEKDWKQKINKKENRKAIRSAIAATLSKTLVRKNGFFCENIPLIVEDEMESLSKTKELRRTLQNLNLIDDLQRISIKRVRAGKGKNRGRPYRTKKGPLIVVSKNCKLINACKNLKGIEVSKVDSLNTEVLAPGTNPGRLVIWTKPSIERLTREKLFTEKRISVKKENKEK